MDTPDTRPWFRRTQAEVNQAKDLLVTTEETGTKTGRQIRTIAPWAYQAAQPTLGQMRVGRLRIGDVAQHR